MLLSGRTAIVWRAPGRSAKKSHAPLCVKAPVVLSARRREPWTWRRKKSAERLVTPRSCPSTPRIHDASTALDEVVRRHGPVSLMFNAVPWDDVQGQA